MSIALNRNWMWVSLILCLGIAGILAFYLVIPKWWLSVSFANYEEWHPIYGKWLYLLFRRVLPLILVLNAVLLIIIHHEKAKQFFWDSVGRTSDLYKVLIQAATTDYLGERRFISHLFFSLVSLIYAVAFSSILWQIELVIPNGLIPFKEFVETTHSKEGAISVFVYPSIFWISQTEWFIQMILLSALSFAVYGIFFKMRLYGFLFLWFTYVSFVNFGRDLFHFPWDTFLCEVGFLTVLGVYFIRHRGFMPGIILGLFLALFFRQWFSMALVKILWEADYSWYNLTFMKFYWLNQPSPTPLAACLSRLPMPFHNITTLFTLILEILIPISLFLGRNGRIAAFTFSAILSLFIQLNGNFGFFNLLTACLGVWCLDDYLFYRRSKILSNIKRPRILGFAESSLILFSITIFILNIFYSTLQFSKEAKHPMNIVNYYFSNKRVADADNIVSKSIMLYGQAISRFRIVSPHGVFKSIAKERQQIQIHVKEKDGQWQRTHFNKGHDLDQLHFFAPFMNHLPMKFSAHWAHRTDFSFYLNIHTNTKYIKSYKQNLIEAIFVGNSEVNQVYTTLPLQDIEEIKVLRIRLNPEDTSRQPFRYSSKENIILDSIIFKRGDTIDFSLFDRDPRLQIN
jgi:uncharacterized membrane protein YphA (DoxX/SURF4 family)